MVQERRGGLRAFLSFVPTDQALGCAGVTCEITFALREALKVWLQEISLLTK